MFGTPDICLCPVLQSLWASQPSACEHPGPLLRVQVYPGRCRPGRGALRPVLCPRERDLWHSRSSQKSSPDRPSRAKPGMEPPLRPPCGADAPLAPRNWPPELGPQAALSGPVFAWAGKGLCLSVFPPRRRWHHRSPLLGGIRKGQAGDRKVRKQTPLTKQNQTDTETSKSREATVGIDPGVRFQAKRNQHSRHMSCTSCGQPGPGPGGRRGNPGTEGHRLCPGGAREQVPCPPVTEEPPLPVVGSGSWGREWALTPHSAAVRANVL